MRWFLIYLDERIGFISTLLGHDAATPDFIELSLLFGRQLFLTITTLQN